MPESATPGSTGPRETAIGEYVMGAGAATTSAQAPPRADATARIVVALGIVAVLVLAGGAYLVWLRPTSSTSAQPPASSASPSPGDVSPAPAESTAEPSPSPDLDSQRQAARSLDAVVVRSSQSRAKLHQALGFIDACRVPSAQGLFNQVVLERQGELSTLDTLVLDSLPEGEALRRQLAEAIGQALNADRAYQRWAVYLAGHGCRAGHNGDWTQAQAYDDQAGTAKVAFATAWNAMAARVGGGLLPHSREDF